MSGKKDERVFVVHSANIHPKTPPEIQREILEKEAAKADAGLKWGVLIILIGVLTLFGTYTYEPMTVIVQSAGLKTKLTQACPAALIALIGLAIIFLTQFKFNHTPK